MLITRVTSPRVVTITRRDIGAYIAVTLFPITPGDPSGTTAATLSVVNSEDASHAWALTNDAGGRFVIDENTGVVTLTGEAVGGVYVITAAATGNPSGGVLTRNITIRVTLTETAWLPQMILLMEL